jgi:site-specific recombinase
LGATVAPLVASNKVISLEEFLRQKPELLDSAARSLYQACAFALLELIVDQTDGAGHLSRYIDNRARASNDPLADLKAAFPVLQNEDADTIWRASVAKLAGARRWDLLTVAETDRHLTGLLKSKRLQDFLDRKLSAAEKIELRGLSTELLLLATSSNPALRPVVVEYREIVQLMALGKRSGLPKRLARLTATHAKLVARMDQVDDYMNWFEATQATTTSGAFAEYLRSAAKPEAEHRRRDAISVYLDALELQIQD